jgi:hypothetical protein
MLLLGRMKVIPGGGGGGIATAVATVTSRRSVHCKQTMLGSAVTVF